MNLYMILTVLHQYIPPDFTSSNDDIRTTKLCRSFRRSANVAVLSLFKGIRYVSLGTSRRVHISVPQPSVIATVNNFRYIRIILKHFIFSDTTQCLSGESQGTFRRNTTSPLHAARWFLTWLPFSPVFL
jgi:hypothetical protein